MAIVGSDGSNEAIATIIMQMVGPLETQAPNEQPPQIQVAQPDLERILEEFLHNAELAHGGRDLQQVNVKIQEESAQLALVRIVVRELAVLSALYTATAFLYLTVFSSSYYHRPETRLYRLLDSRIKNLNGVFERKTDS